MATQWFEFTVNGPNGCGWLAAILQVGFVMRVRRQRAAVRRPTVGRCAAPLRARQASESLTQACCPSAACRAGAATALLGAGLLINEGEVLFHACSFQGNTNGKLGEGKAREQDVCAFGASAQAIFDKYSPAVCTARGGQGTCM